MHLLRSDGIADHECHNHESEPPEDGRLAVRRAPVTGARREVPLLHIRAPSGLADTPATYRTQRVDRPPPCLPPAYSDLSTVRIKWSARGWLRRSRRARRLLER